jgi:hypothetical protein
MINIETDLKAEIKNIEIVKFVMMHRNKFILIILDDSDLTVHQKVTKVTCQMIHKKCKSLTE